MEKILLRKRKHTRDNLRMRLTPVWTFLAAANLFARERVIPTGEAFGRNVDYFQRTRGLKAARSRTVAPLRNNNDNYDDIGGDFGGDASGSEAEAAAYWELPNDFSMFLTQRSVQSFMFLTSQLRDPETCYWVEDFTQPNLVSSKNKIPFSLSETIPNLGDIATAGTRDWTRKSTGTETEADQRQCHLLRYHGLAAMDTVLFPTWESYFENMLEEPTDSWVIASEQKHIPNYVWEIDPNSLCSRILSVREQLSKEFLKDLQAVSDMGGQTLEWYWDRLKTSRDQEQQQQQQPPQDDAEDDSHHGSSNGLFESSSSLKGYRENLLFLEINVDDPTLDHKPSPLRRGNFDLLVLLSTEEAIHRVLNRWESKRAEEGKLVGSEQASHAFLEQFYSDRQHFFHGPLPSYGKADDLLEELLDSALHFTMDDHFDASAVVHPTMIAELVLKERERVALDWMDIARDAPKHHMRIQKLRLTKMMSVSASITTNTDESNGKNENPSTQASTTRNGDFDPGPGTFE